ncbi:MAG: hypothetical protein SPF55_04590 [Lentihominibacter sp.]|nr:hypothetical protein [Lentihominibacter sp.]
MKRLIALITTVAMVVCMMPALAFATDSDVDNSPAETTLNAKSAAEESVFSKMEVEPASGCEAMSEDGASAMSTDDEVLQSQIDSANAGATIYISKDMYLYDTVYIGKNLTLDLQGHTVYAYCEDAFYIYGGAVTVRNGGVANGYSTYLGADSIVTCFLVSDANVTLSSLKIWSSSGVNSFGAVGASGSAVLNVKSCSITMCASTMEAAGIVCVGNVKANITSTSINGKADSTTACLACENSRINIYSGNFWANCSGEDTFSAAISVEDNGYVYVDGGYYACTYGSVYLADKNSKMCINRGEFRSSASNYSAFSNGYYNTYTTNVSLASGTTVAQNYISKWTKYGCRYVAFSKKPVATKIKKLKKGSKKLTAYWYSKGSAVSGYIVQAARNKSFTKGVKTVYVAGGSKKSKTITKLSKKKYYYVRVCTYTKAYGERFLSSWSGVKKIKTR